MGISLSWNVNTEIDYIGQRSQTKEVNITKSPEENHKDTLVPLEERQPSKWKIFHRK